MAIIPCRECTHQVSDQAANCPSCGAPVTHTVKIEPRGKREIFRISVVLMALWTVGTILWLAVPRSASNQLVTHAKLSLERFDRQIGQFPATDQTKATHRNAAADQAPSSKASESRAGLASSERSNAAQLVTAHGSGSALPAPAQAVPALRPVYRTTAQQLYQEYNANVVAIRTKIGASRVRVTGVVAEIDQDVAGRPVVKLWTGKDSKAAMRLTEDQRAAAAQLAKDEAVEIECDSIGHSAELLEGGDCILALVDVMSRQVNLALFVANDNGTTGVYVVGPMPEAACLAQDDSISSKLPLNHRGEYVVWRGCTDAARESIPPGGCRLNSSPVTVPDMPPAHLWRYDCGSSSVQHTSARKRTATSSHGTAAATMDPNTESATGTEPATGNPSGRDESQGSTAPAPFPIPMLVSKAVAVAPPEAATSPAGTTAPVGAGTAPAPRAAAEHAETNDIRLASASNSDIGTGNSAAQAPVEEVTVAHAPQGRVEHTANPQGDTRDTTSPAPIATPPDDLAQVRAVDPQAADHIATYCSKTLGSANRSILMSECRHRETEAWTRLVLQKEFPTLDEATRKRCSEPPFPDTYVAKESCARYELHMN